MKNTLLLYTKLVIINILVFAHYTAYTSETGNNASYSSKKTDRENTGKLMLIGGGMERSQATAWNYEAFNWIIDNAANSKILVIGNTSGDGWLEENFMSVWGAAYSKELVITSSNADIQATYDTIVQYDAVYLRGGDQYYYYNNFKGTKTQEAIEYIFANGGVIAGTSAGMHVLTNVIFTDDTGYSIFPDEAIENPNHNYITLHNDLFQFLPGTVGDSHFSERGRFGRLLGFMANWQFNYDEIITGFGIDDLTAFAIDENLIGTVFGTGCANIYIANENTFSQNPPDNGKLLANDIMLIQLLQGSSIDLNTFEIINNLENESVIDIEEESGNYTILASGGDALSENSDMLEYLTEMDDVDNILILTGSNHNIANQFKNALESFGAANVEVHSATTQFGISTVLMYLLIHADALLFVNNSYNGFKEFLNTHNGELLSNISKSPNMINVFVGDNSRFAGAVVVEKYLTAGASYFAELEFYDGLGLMQTTVIMPNTYKSSNIYENTVTAVPFAMVNHGLKYGIWLNSKNFFKYYPENGETFITSYGDSPVMILKNDSEYSGNSQQASHGTTLPVRQISGFDKMQLALIDESVQYKLGEYTEPPIHYYHVCFTNFNDPFELNAFINGEEITSPAIIEEGATIEFVAELIDGLLINTWYINDIPNGHVEPSLTIENLSYNILVTLVVYHENNIANENMLDVELYPNPAKDIVNITLPDGNFNIGLYSLTGELILEKHSYSSAAITLENLNGMFVLRITDNINGNSIYKKLLIAK